MEEMKNKTKGFTLIELLIVIGIIAILASAVIVAIAPGEQLDKARDATVRSHMQAIATSAYSYVIDNDGTTTTAFADLDIDKPSHPGSGDYSFAFSGGRVVVTEEATCVSYDPEGCLIITY